MPLFLGLIEGADALAGTLGDHADVSTVVTVVRTYAGTADFRMMTSGAPWGYFGYEEGNLDFAAFASRISHVSPDDPAVLLLHGTRDQSLRFEQAAVLWPPIFLTGNVLHNQRRRLLHSITALNSAGRRSAANACETRHNIAVPTWRTPRASRDTYP